MSTTSFNPVSNNNILVSRERVSSAETGLVSLFKCWLMEWRTCLWKSVWSISCQIIVCPLQSTVNMSNSCVRILYKAKFVSQQRLFVCMNWDANCRNQIKACTVQKYQPLLNVLCLFVLYMGSSLDWKRFYFRLNEIRGKALYFWFSHCDVAEMNELPTSTMNKKCD